MEIENRVTKGRVKKKSEEKPPHIELKKLPPSRNAWWAEYIVPSKKGVVDVERREKVAAATAASLENRKTQKQTGEYNRNPHTP